MLLPKDQPTNPRIRTKLLRLEPEFDDALFSVMEQLRGGVIDVPAYQARIIKLLEDARLMASFGEDIKIAKAQNEQHWLVRRHTDDCRYTLLFFKVNENEIHPPHQHHNLISTQVVIEGNVHLREYQRLRRNDEGALELRLERDAILGPGDVFQASEWRLNAHWFGAVGGPAVLLNLNARGYEKTTFANDDQGPFGRRYLDPCEFDDAGVITCEEIDEAEGERRFQGRKLADFTAPKCASRPGANMTISL